MAVILHWWCDEHNYILSVPPICVSVENLFLHSIFVKGSHKMPRTKMKSAEQVRKEQRKKKRNGINIINPNKPDQVSVILVKFTPGVSGVGIGNIVKF